MKHKKSFIKVSLFIFSLFLIAVPVYAAEVIGPTQGNSSVVVGAQENHKNLYVAGGDVAVNGNTAADLTAAGGTVELTGNVQNEALIAGGTLNIFGDIGGNARFVGGNITISGPMAGDVAIAGGNVTLTSSASVGGDLLIAGGDVTVDAPVKGDIRVLGGNVTLGAGVGGAVYAQTSKSLTFASGAQVLGQVQYKGPQAAVVQSGAKIPQIQFIQTAPRGFVGTVAGLITLTFLVKLLAWLIAAFVVVKFRKHAVIYLNEEFQKKPWQNLGWGLLAFVGIPIITLILFLTFVGYYLALLLGVTYVFLVVAANLLSAVVLGYFLLSKMNKPGEALLDWQAILIGVFLWLVLSIIPILGWLVMAIIFLMVLGVGVKKLKTGFNN